MAKTSSSSRGSSKSSTKSRSGSKSASRSGSSGSSSKAGSGKAGSSRRGSGKRELIAPRGDKRYVRRDGKGRFNESDDVSKSLSRDRRQHAKTKTKPGYGDRGDR
jgi:hypothetical protein